MKYLYLPLFILQFGSLSASKNIGDSITFFTAKSDISIALDGDKQDFTAHIRYKPCDSLWLSFTGTLGIEGARLLRNKDSLFIYNKIENTFEAMDAEEPNEYIPFSFSWADWNAILFNQVVFAPEDSVLTLKEGVWTKKTVGDNECVREYYYNQNQQLDKMILRKQRGNEICIVLFSEYKIIDTFPNPVAQKKEISIRGDVLLPTEIVIQNHKMQLNQSAPMPFKRRE